MVSTPALVEYAAHHGLEEAERLRLVVGVEGVLVVVLAEVDIVANSDLWAIVPERFARRAVRSGRLYQATGPTVPMRQAHYLLRRDNAERTTGESLAFERWLRAQDAEDPTL